MHRTPVIPNRHVILFPFEPHLRVMILRQQIEQILEQQIRLVLRHAVDPRREAAVDEHTFPARGGVRADDGVAGAQVGGRVERATADPRLNGVAHARGVRVEEIRVVGCCQTFQELLHRWGETVVDLVAGCPEGVAAGGREGVDLKHGVVRGDGLEGDVAVPADGGVAAVVVLLVGDAAAEFLGFAADGADAWPGGEFGSVFVERVGVEAGGGRAAGEGGDEFGEGLHLLGGDGLGA